MDKNYGGQKLSIEINSIVIRGEIHFLQSNNIVVKILFPFTGITNGVYLPAITMNDEKNSYVKDGKLTKKGIDTADFLLEEIYRFCDYFEKNIKELKKVYIRSHKTMSQKHKDAIDQHEFIKEKQELRRRLKNNEFTKDEHQMNLRALRQKYEENWKKQLEIENRIRDHIENDIKKIIGVDILHQLIKKYL
jgi:hypothetical protein